MGNNPSSASKQGASSTSAGAMADSKKQGSASSQPDDHHHHPHHPFHPLPHHRVPGLQHHESAAKGARKEARNIYTTHTTQRSAAPPEASLAQARGSNVNKRPTSNLSGTAVSSLSASPHSNLSTPTKSSHGVPAAVAGDTPSKPVDVPGEPTSLRSALDPLANEPMNIQFHLISHNSVTDMYLRGPPRLPLPIEEEIHRPGSPILAPEERLSDVELGESSDGLTRKSSAVSATTADDDDSKELRVDKTRPVVPTRLEWKRGGEKVYVTGTIFQWNRKQRLHPCDGKPGCFATTVHILPGTHHIRFLVDGIMQTSPDLPTTVDFGNNLVNYIEVNPDDVPLAQRSKPEGEAGGISTASQSKEQQRAPRGKFVNPLENNQSAIPQYLVDFDQPEDSPAYRNAVAAIEMLPTPPSLPGFLGKPILNAATLMKDDNSVLNMPNHTVLNHLATSSIKNNVLAVSATTRYHNKYVTTILYKPTSSDEG